MNEEPDMNEEKRMTVEEARAIMDHECFVSCPVDLRDIIKAQGFLEGHEAGRKEALEEAAKLRREGVSDH